MKNRARLLMAATACLYFGPLLAGLGGFGWAVVPVFAGIFMLWLVIIRPQDFPRKLADWGRAEALVGFAARAAVQLLLVVILFGIGRGIGGAFGILPNLPVMLPIALSFLSIPVARLIWDPWKAQAMDEFLDDALSKIEATGGGGDDRPYAEALLTPLGGLPDSVTEAELESHLAALRDLVNESMIFEVLLLRAKQADCPIATRRALMLLASDGAALERMVDIHGAPVAAMTVLRDDPALIGRMADRLAAALRADPDIWPELPSPDFLKGLIAELPSAAPMLTRLQAEVVALTPAK